MLKSFITGETIRRSTPKKRPKRSLLLSAPLGLAALWSAWALHAQPLPVTAIASATIDPAAVAIEQRFHTQIKPLLAKYCYECHGNGQHDGNLQLDQYNSLAGIQADGKTWRSVQNLVQLGMMPQDEKLKPAPAEVATLAAFINDAIDYVDTAAPRDPGRVTLHRLNRTEYDNTIRDLLYIDISNNKPSRDFPADDTGYGFDNIADVLSISPLLAGKYIAAAESSLDKAIEPLANRQRKVIKILPHQMEGTVGQPEEDGWNLYMNGEVYVDRPFPLTADYEFRIRAQQDQAGDQPARMTVKLDGKDLQTFDVAAIRGKPEIYTLRHNITAGTHRLAAAFINDFYDEKIPDEKHRDRNLYIDSIAIDGPINPPPTADPPPLTQRQRKTFFLMPGSGVSEEQAATAILNRFASRAFRRPASAEETQRLVKLFKQIRSGGEPFISSVKVAMTAVLVSPHFLYRVELDPPLNADNTPLIRPLNNNELATRLSYFLWSSMPDDALLDAAGTLHDPQSMAAQVRRMIADPKADALINNFVGQWLELRNLDNVSPNHKSFPDFNGNLARSMRREGEMFFGSILRDNRPLTELLDANYTFLNDRLARLYGIPGVSGDKMRRVDLPADSHRGGVLTMAGVLTVTSMPARTSPVKRGRWILEELLDDAPPPPPPGVPVLPAKLPDNSKFTFRQRLEQHRVDVTCAGCHARMDPLGFAMDHYNAIGAWRDRDGTHEIDATGALPGGQTFNGADELKRLLLDRRKNFIRCLAEKMLTYALGRGLEDYDRATVYDICRSVENSGYNSSSLVLAIVQCDAFQKRRIGPPLRQPVLAAAPAAANPDKKQSDQGAP
jgi:hypothetical protein